MAYNKPEKQVEQTAAQSDPEGTALSEKDLQQVDGMAELSEEELQQVTGGPIYMNVSSSSGGDRPSES